MDTNVFTWTNGDNLIEPIVPYPDVTGFQFHFGAYSNGGTYRSGISLKNQGRKNFQIGIEISGDNAGYDTGINFGATGTAINTGSAYTQAILMGCGTFCSGSSPGVTDGRISFGSGTTMYIQPHDYASPGLDIGGTVSGVAGILSIVPASAGSGKSPWLKYSGAVQMTARAFSFLDACSGSLEGSMAAVTDSTTNTWGATITGGSGSHVLAYCDGTNWTVAGK